MKKKALPAKFQETWDESERYAIKMCDLRDKVIDAAIKHVACVGGRDGINNLTKAVNAYVGFKLTYKLKDSK